MVKHIVMWKLRAGTPQQNRDSRRAVKASLESLGGRVPGLVQLEVGCDESGTEAAFDVVLVSVFASMQALQAYATDPEHLRVKQEMAGLGAQRHQVDFSVEDGAA